MFRRNLVLILLACSAAALAQQVPQTFKIEPLRPVEELRAEALKAQPPAETGDFFKPDLGTCPARSYA